MKTMYFAIEANLIVWIALAAYLFSGPPDSGTLRAIVFTGGGLAALLPHGAHYVLRRGTRGSL
jgi:hypothetical protein